MQGAGRQPKEPQDRQGIAERPQAKDPSQPLGVQDLRALHRQEQQAFQRLLLALAANPRRRAKGHADEPQTDERHAQQADQKIDCLRRKRGHLRKTPGDERRVESQANERKTQHPPVPRQPFERRPPRIENRPVDGFLPQQRLIRDRRPMRPNDRGGGLVNAELFRLLERSPRCRVNPDPLRQGPARQLQSHGTGSQRHDG